MQDAEHAATRLFDRGRAAGQTELTEVCDALKRFVVGKEKFSTPNSAVETVAGAVPCHTERGRFNLIFGHASRDVRPMMLNGMRGNGQMRREFCRKIVGMHIAGDDIDLSVVELGQVLRRALEGAVGLLSFEIANVLTNEDVGPDTERDGVLQMCADCEHGWKRCL